MGVNEFERGFNALAGEGRKAEAMALMRASVAAGDPAAQHGLGMMKLYAVGVPRDIAGAVELLAGAALKNHGEARRTLAALFANGTGVPEDAGRARALLAPIADAADVAEQLRVAALDEPRAVEFEGLCEAPLVARVHGLLLEEECDYLVARAEPRLQPSIIVDPLTGKGSAHPHRDSSGIAFGPAEEDLVVRRITRRVAAASRTGVECGEPLQILAYDAGQQYRPHLDALPGVANQRAWTMLLWLNDEYEGGETAFPEAGLTVRGKKRDALLFENVTADGRADPRARHAGLPVTAGRKWLATRWIRTRGLAPFEVS